MILPQVSFALHTHGSRQVSRMKQNLSHSLLALAMIAGACGTLAGCRGDRDDAPPRQFFPDLDDQLKWKPQSGSEFFSDGRTMRHQVQGAVAFGRTSFDPASSGEAWAAPYAAAREDLERSDPAVYQGLDRDGKAVKSIPVPVTMEMVQLGQQKFNIYCSVCHGYLGDGKGQVGLQWATPVANFHDAKYKKPDPATPGGGDLWTDGHIFRTGMFGLYDVSGNQKMPGYAHALSARDGWAVVAYIRSLQASREGMINDVPEGDRPALEKSRADALQAAAPAKPANGGAK
jgi:mono/diheme cytochrome c family protein